MVNIVVQQSKIHELGVFASRGFKNGEVVLRWDVSHELTPEQVKKLSKNEKRYISYFNGIYILMQPPERYVNHSCNPNTYANNFCDTAKRKIKKGEEITTDYTKVGVRSGKEDGVTELNIKCKCGSKNCKKVIKIIA